MIQDKMMLFSLEKVSFFFFCQYSFHFLLLLSCDEHSGQILQTKPVKWIWFEALTQTDAPSGFPFRTLSPLLLDSQVRSWHVCYWQIRAETFRWAKQANDCTRSGPTGNALINTQPATSSCTFCTWRNEWFFFKFYFVPFFLMTWFWFSTPDNLPPWCVSRPSVLVIYCKNMFL